MSVFLPARNRRLLIGLLVGHQELVALLDEFFVPDHLANDGLKLAPHLGGHPTKPEEPRGGHRSLVLADSV